MFQSNHSFDPELLGNIMFSLLPGVSPKSILHIEGTAVCFSCFAEAI